MPTTMELHAMAGEDTPLLGAAANEAPLTLRERVYRFLEAQTPGGRRYERFMIVLIVGNVLAFILGTVFDPQYQPETSKYCNRMCDLLWFGNRPDNGLGQMHLGTTSILELVTIAVFTIEYILRLWIADLESPAYRGVVGRLRFAKSFFSLVDLASTLPFYLDILLPQQLAASGFVRMFRLLRMMRVEGRYDTALTMIDDVYERQKGLLGTAGFIGMTTWMTVSALYYLTERRNNDMIYCPTCADIDTSACVEDEWGQFQCDDCPPTNETAYPCYNLYESIPMASYYALLNLFGEFPLIAQHSNSGKLVGTLTAVVAVAVFALPAGIIGNGFETVIGERAAPAEQGPIVEDPLLTPGFIATDSTSRGRWYNRLHARTAASAQVIDGFINLLILVTASAFMVETATTTGSVLGDAFEFCAVGVFTIEYSLRVWSVGEDPRYQQSRVGYLRGFLPLVDLLSFAPYWLLVAWTGKILSPEADSTFATAVKSLRLLRILRFERYTHAFASFDNVILRNLDVLTVTAFTAVLIWVLGAAMLYLSERDNPDPEMAANYSSMPNAMWITLLNLSGESPLAQYSLAGKITTGILGLFATGLFGIPIGVLGAGFEEVVEEENADNEEELRHEARGFRAVGSTWEQGAYTFVNGLAGVASRIFEAAIYVLILMTVSVGIWQTVDGHENDMSRLEWLAVIVFTVEYLIRLVGAGADPEFAEKGNAVTCRLRFIGSFYSIVDLLAIVPFYIAFALPNSFVNDYDEYLRMFRILRLVKLDKYIPSITLIDDVIRLKFNTLRVASYAAITLWILFAAAMYLTEHMDSNNDIDPVPRYGCDQDCTMMDRFQNFFDSMVYTGIHLTGDYPIITYSWPARFVNFFMVIAAVGVVSVPSGLIASGFVQIVQSKNKALRGEEPAGRAGDDWYEHRYRMLEHVDPPNSRFGPKVDWWQNQVNEFLNGKEDENGHKQWTRASFAERIFMFTVIVSNVLAVVLESIPRIDKAVGNQPGNFFDVFEACSVMVFAAEYVARLFCAPKNRDALYSTLIYATTFFGIVDFISTAPWFVEQAMLATGHLDEGGDNAKIFRIFRIFRILQLEDFIVAFSKLDNVFRASKDVLKATGLMALIIWIGCGALFYIFEENNPNWRSCDESVPVRSDTPGAPGCYDFRSTSACNIVYPGLCTQTAFTNMPNALYFTAVFLGGEWGVVDFTWPGRLVCLFLCVVGIGLYAIPIGTLFDSFGAILGLVEEDEEEEEETDAGATSTK